MAETTKIGPSGGGGGSEFSDDALPQSSRVIEVRIRHGKYVDAIEIIHETNTGARYPMPIHGGSGGGLDVFTLDSDEYITGISGGCGALVDSLRIHTNRQISQLYGGGGGNPYRYEVTTGSAIVGFFGRCGKYVDAIGIIVRKN